MIPTWLTVDQARSRLRSLWPKASTPARTIVTEVAIPSSQRAGSLTATRSNSWPRTTVPAATIVAAWMRAEAGVGPSMASGSQSWKGTWADLPRMPMMRRERSTARRVPSGAVHTPPAGQSPTACHAVMTLRMAVLPAPAARPRTPRTKPMSANRVTRKALWAARRALSLRDQCPMSR